MSTQHPYPAPGAPQPQPQPPQPKKTSRWLIALLVVIGLLALLFLGSCLATMAKIGESVSSTATPLDDSSIEASSSKSSKASVSAKPRPKSTLSTTQEQAVGTAQDYLDGQHFSRK